MLVAVDVHYKEDYAKTVLVLFDNWLSETCSELIDIQVNHIAEYIPGEFYKRELPCILEALKQIDLQNISLLIVDGYVYTDNKKSFGLGGHLFTALEGKIPVAGVAKTKFQNNQETVEEVYRGESKNPLYVSSIGIEKEVVANHVREMYGDFRLPYLLRLMDQKTKEE